MNITARTLWRALWRPVGSLAVVALILWLVPLGEFRAVLARIDPLLATLALALVLPMAAAKAAVFWLAATVQGLVFSFRQMLAIQLASAFYTLVVPGQLGGTVSRWYKLQKPGRQPVEAAAVMLMARLLETGTACLIGLALAMADPVARALGVVPVLTFVFLAIGGGGLLLVTPVGRRLGRALADRLPRHRWLEGVHRALPRLRDAAQRMRRMRPGAILRIVACSVLWNGLALLSMVLAAMAVGAEVSWVTLGWLRSLLAIILLLPLGWGGLGVREASTAALLAPYGVAPAMAVAIGAIVSLRNILEAVLGAGVELAALWRKGRPSRVAPAPLESAPLDGARLAR
jgi:glycosyltransferase 2 family protein